MKIAVALVTRGRPLVAEAFLRRLTRQTRAPDIVIVSATGSDDLGDALGAQLGEVARIAYGEPGVSAQRNRALDLARDADVIVFFDDDFAPFPDSLSGIERLFSARRDLVAATGHVIADGAKGAPIEPATAEMLAAAPRPRIPQTSVVGLYGCNMAIRMSAVGAQRFDEGLPLYGWQEDLDFGARLKRRGDVVRTGAFGGVHMGVKGGRHPQRGLGYAQIANAVRIAQRGAVPVGYVARLALRNLAANVFGAVFGDPWADRRGRLRGNILALSDLIAGRIDPERARDL